MRIRVRVPTLNDSLEDFDRLFSLRQRVGSKGLKVSFRFDDCRFLRQNAVAFLGGLARLIEWNGGTVSFEWSSLQWDVRRNLARNGFLSSFGSHETVPQGNAIPFRQDRQLDRDGIVKYLSSDWLGRGWVHVSPMLRSAIVNRVCEIYTNAFEHASSPIGVFSCGQHYPNMGQLKLTVVDFGVGIPYNVREFLANRRMSTAEALKWAFQSGTTTKPYGISRGIGLNLLKEFVRINKGQLEIFSHDGYVLVDESNEFYTNRSSYFEGTLVNITFRCDERFYVFASEVGKEPLF